MTHPDWQEAIGIAARAGASTPQPVESLPLADCQGRVLAETLAADRDIPHFDSSAMDGFAVHGPPPWRLEATTASGADAHAASGTRPLKAGCARPILTGGVVPAGATSVVRVEHAEVSDDAAGPRLDMRRGAPSDDLTAGRHIRHAGRETTAGETLLEGGRVLSPADVAYAAVSGRDVLPVRRRPRIALIMTGDEVITAGQPTPGHVRDTFGPVLPGLITGLGGAVVSAERIADDAALTAAALRRAVAAAEVVLTTGGTGRSHADHVRRESMRVADRVLFSELAMRPGHPTTFARLESDGEMGAWHVGLPGNPLAAMTAVRVVVEPLLSGMLGRPLRAARSVQVAVDVRPVRTSTLMPARVGADGRWAPCHARGANMLRGLSEGDGFLIVPPAGLAAGAAAEVLDLPWPRW